MLVMVHLFVTELWPFHEISCPLFFSSTIDRFGSNYTNRLSIKQRCAYPILVMVSWSYVPLMTLDKFLSNFMDRLCTQQRSAYHKLFLVN